LRYAIFSFATSSSDVKTSFPMTTVWREYTKRTLCNLGRALTSAASGRRKRAALEAVRLRRIVRAHFQWMRATVEDVDDAIENNSTASSPGWR
jgi:hypothetical protein